MFRHVPTPGVNSIATISLEKWLDNVLKVSKFGGDDLVMAYVGKGDVAKIERKRCGLLFKDFKPAYGRPGAYLATPMEVVEISEVFGRALNSSKAIVPIGDIDYKDASLKNVLQNCARQWCGGGSGNVALNDTNVFIMYYSAIQSLAFEFVQSKTLEELDKWACPLLSLVSALATLHEELPFAKRVTETMITAPSLDDMLQKALAHAFAGVKPTMEDQVEMLENIVRRTYRAGEEFRAASPGPLAVFLMAPLLANRLSSGDGSMRFGVTFFVDAFNKSMQSYTEALLPKTTHIGQDVRSILALTQVAFEKPLTKEQIDGFLAFLKANPTASVPWVSLGVLPPHEPLVPSLFAGPFDVKGKPLATLSTVIKVKGPTSFTAVGKKGSDWTGVQFLSSGEYIIHLTMLGMAEVAKGDSRGEDLKANLRLTLGKDIMASQEYSYSLAGMEQLKAGGRLETYSLAGERCVMTTDVYWDIRQNKAMDSMKPLLVKVSKQDVRLIQDNDVFAMFPREDKPVLVAFKNVLLTVNFDEGNAPVTKTASWFAVLSEE